MFVAHAFAFATETTIEGLKNCSKNENTAKSTGFWLSVWRKWRVEKEITDIILLQQKFLQFDWLRAVVFQLNLKYLHVKITNLLRVVV